MLVKLGSSSPSFGVKIKKVWNHQPTNHPKKNCRLHDWKTWWTFVRVGCWHRHCHVGCCCTICWAAASFWREFHLCRSWAPRTIRDANRLSPGSQKSHMKHMSTYWSCWPFPYPNPLAQSGKGRWLPNRHCHHQFQDSPIAAPCPTSLITKQAQVAPGNQRRGQTIFSSTALPVPPRDVAAALASRPPGPPESLPCSPWMDHSSICECCAVVLRKRVICGHQVDLLQSALTTICHDCILGGGGKSIPKYIRNLPSFWRYVHLRAWVPFPCAMLSWYLPKAW